MRKSLSLVALGAAALTMAFVACGEDGTTDFSCATDADCQTGEICHPDAFFCVQTCTSSDECPSYAKTCEAVSATETQQVCKCSTDQLCAGDDGLGPDFACSDSFEICVPKCTSDLDCPTGQSCNAASECAPSTPTGDACQSYTEQCPNAGQICDVQNQVCVDTPSCSGTGQSTCAYGQYCSGSSCAWVEEPTCSNITDNANASSWNPASDNGPVIFNIEPTTDTSWPCGDATTSPLQARVQAYRTDMAWPSTLAGNSGFFYVRVNGSETSAIPLIRPTSGYMVDGEVATFLVNFCFPTADSQVQIGLYFTDGNGACETLER